MVRDCSRLIAEKLLKVESRKLRHNIDAGDWRLYTYQMYCWARSITDSLLVLTGSCLGVRAAKSSQRESSSHWL
ncbi:hypothetical protein VNO78_16000 [Psophocarpus tetragonolobus]|uniref:Uncharacterized protein n=1 Tax=Psophocarpus tetragonolobus TaxID=3891 RepID=A0AAN9XJP0_PSOTE